MSKVKLQSTKIHAFPRNLHSPSQINCSFSSNSSKSAGVALHNICLDAASLPLTPPWLSSPPPPERLKLGTLSSPCCLCFCWWTKLWDLTKRIKVTAVNETQLGLDHNRRNQIAPPQMHRQHVLARAHALAPMWSPSHSLPPSNAHLEARRQAANHLHVKRIIQGLLSHSSEPD